MTEQEIDQFMEELQQLQPWMAATSVSAWVQVLAEWEPGDALQRLVDVQAVKDRVAPADFNLSVEAAGGSEPWALAWVMVQERVARVGKVDAIGEAADGVWPDPAACAAAMTIRRELTAGLAEDRLKWIFRDAYRDAVAGVLGPVLEAGRRAELRMKDVASIPAALLRGDDGPEVVVLPTIGRRIE